MMKSLAEILLAEPHQQALFADCTRLMEDYVAGRGGIKGMGLRAGMKMLKAAKPGILERATVRLLPEFLSALDPLYQQFQTSRGKSFESYLQVHAGSAAEALLGVADRRAQNASPTVQSYYSKFRGNGEAEVRIILPGLARIIETYLK